MLPPTTAGIHPESFADDLFFAQNQTVTTVVLVLFLLIGFGLRVNHLGTESLSEDELNKLQTIEEYRFHGLSGKNGEHPFLMKGLQTVSIIAAEKLNASISMPQYKISEEAALRFPLVLAGTFTMLLIFLLVSELFGRSIGLISAIFWAIEPMAIGFDRIAKEDSLVLFFFLLTGLFWVRGQSAAERGKPNWLWYTWAAAASFAALMASKYYPFVFAIVGSYYAVFQQIPGQKWGLGPKRWLKFLIIMGVVFLILNPTIMLPDTWREMLKFSSEGSIGRDSYEYLGHFYENRVSAWLAGVPWTFYYVFVAVKTSLLTLALMLIGLPLMFKRKLGDGRFFIFFWAFFLLMPFTLMGGKFTRYFTLVEPLVLISAAVCVYYSLKWISVRLGKITMLARAVEIVLLVTVVVVTLYNSVAASPHFRLFTNSIGIHFAPAGSYFPHDEFYDASTREIVAEIAHRARQQAVVACETPTVFEYYAHKIGRKDLVFISLSDREKVGTLSAGDIVVAAKGRNYLSNAAFVGYLANSATPAAETTVAGITSAEIYQLGTADAVALREMAAK